VFGICLGHQILGIALGARSYKLKFGHHGANHPVIHLDTGRIEITSQNHGFALREETLPPGVRVTHRSLNDKTVEGIESLEVPAYSVQYHPEASPGPHDSAYLFDRFVQMMERQQRRSA
jgi:carbamoyl-phosphate synthase small subunit